MKCLKNHFKIHEAPIYNALVYPVIGFAYPAYEGTLRNICALCSFDAHDTNLTGGRKEAQLLRLHYLCEHNSYLDAVGMDEDFLVNDIMRTLLSMLGLPTTSTDLRYGTP